MINRNDVAGLFKSMGATGIPAEQVDPEAEANTQRKELKKFLDSYMSVAEHILGRPATIDEMIGILKEASHKPENAAEEASPTQTDLAQTTKSSIVFNHDQTPLNKTSDGNATGLNILNTKVYFGRDKNKNPDPKSVLFYEHPDGAVYNASASQWEEFRPHVLDHLDSRPVMNNELDINNYILHGMMQPEEYEALGNMLPENCHKMWGLKKTIEDAQTLLNDESQTQADSHGKVIEMEHDLRELLDAVKHLQDDREAMLAVLSEHGLDDQFIQSEDLDVSPEMQMEHEMNRGRQEEVVNPADTASAPGISSTLSEAPAQ